jgi:hypothetical protein
MDPHARAQQAILDLLANAARTLVAEDRIEVTQHGEPVDLDAARGPIRLRARPG